MKSLRILSVMVQASLLWVLFSGVALSASENEPGFPEEHKRERISIGAGVGAILPSTIAGASYSASPTIGFSFEFKPIPWVSVGAVSYTDLLIGSGAPNLFEGALLPQVLFYLGRTGLYAGMEAGISDISMEAQASNRVLFFVFVWGPKAGYQYRFPNSRFSLGPEFKMLFFSSGTSTDSNGVTTTLPSHQEPSFSLTGEWWF